MVTRRGDVADGQDSKDALLELRRAAVTEAVEGRGLECEDWVGGRQGAVGGDAESLVGF